MIAPKVDRDNYGKPIGGQRTWYQRIGHTMNSTVDEVMQTLLDEIEALQKELNERRT